MADRKISLQESTAQLQSCGQLVVHSGWLLQGPLSFWTTFIFYVRWPWPVTEPGGGIRA